MRIISSKITVIGLSLAIVLGFGTTTSLLAAFADDTRMIFTTTRSSAVQRDFANQVLDSGDIVVYHYGAGRDPTGTELGKPQSSKQGATIRKGIRVF